MASVMNGQCSSPTTIWTDSVHDVEIGVVEVEVFVGITTRSYLLGNAVCRKTSGV